MTGRHEDEKDWDLKRLQENAPAMARLLLEVEFIKHDEDWSRCGWCSAKEGSTRGHEETCEWLAVMRQSGVLP